MATTTRRPSILLPSWWLVLFTYMTFGWYWHSLFEMIDSMPFFRHLPILFWPFILIVNLFIISLCTVPRSLINSRFLSWFDSSLFSFIFVIFASVLSVLILTHINALATLLILGTVIAIARLDLQIRAYSTVRSWLSLLIAALIGSGLGIAAHHWHQTDAITSARSPMIQLFISQTAALDHPLSSNLELT
ncbi:hypothetical protein [Synechococcus elongatus]|uniref:Uncharacterized protein n=1 Tax=Synechococcus elongatus PCC 11802 TaxID=2283154 RepID=A0AAT9JTK7_SYNEL